MSLSANPRASEVSFGGGAKIVKSFWEVRGEVSEALVMVPIKEVALNDEAVRRRERDGVRKMPIMWISPALRRRFLEF